MGEYILLKNFHILTVIISISLFILRFFWKMTHSTMMEQRWIKIAPHINDTLLLLSGIVLLFITHFYPFTLQGKWLTEKLVVVMIYILLGFVVLSKKPRSSVSRSAAFIAALASLYLIIQLALTKMPVFMGSL